MRETRSDYEAKTLPYIQSLPSSRLAWVFNIHMLKPGNGGEKGEAGENRRRETES